MTKKVKKELTRLEKYARFGNWLAKKDSNSMWGVCLDQSNEERYVFVSNNWWDLWKEFPKLDRWFFDHLEMAYYTQGGANMTFPDEYTTCSGCSSIFRTTADCNGQNPQYITTEYGRLCRNCIENDPDILIDEFRNKTTKAIPNWGIELIKKEGFFCLDDENKESCAIFENGLHLGQNDNPEEIIKGLEKDGFLDRYDFIFTLNNMSVFTIQFSLWLKERE